jgi:L-seryl-tRNA(Ser) seleniumtransferase
MSKLNKRREFISNMKNVIAVGGLASQVQLNAAPRETGAPSGGEDYYDKLGVTKIINAAGTYTMLTASIMPPSVQAAVAAAAKHPVRLAELQKNSGEYLAKKLQCEGALVTAGAYSGLVLATAACLMKANKCGILDIPTEVSKMKDEVIIQKGHRYGYDQAVRCCGARFVEVNTMDEYKAAFNDKTVGTLFFNAATKGDISREDWIKVAHEHNIPSMNDAAADMPPIANLWNYTQMGFDLVIFSGGKGIRGPQNAGLLLGKKDLIDLAVKNNNPFDGVGRGMKVAKEQIIGMVAAVDWLLSQTDESMAAEFTKRADRISAQLKGIPTLKAEIVTPPLANHVPHLHLTYDPEKVKIAPRDVMMELRKGKPSIELNPSTGSRRAGGPSTIVVGVWMLQPGEELIVAKRLREVLTKAAKA